MIGCLCTKLLVIITEITRFGPYSSDLEHDFKKLKVVHTSLVKINTYVTSTSAFYSLFSLSL